MKSKRSQIWAMTLLLLVLAGCQSAEDRIYPINGKIVFTDGSPAKFGIIEFRSDSPEPIIARGKIKKDGSFRVRASDKPWGLTQGFHQVIIIQVVGNPRGQPKIAHNHGLEVHDKYRSYETSGLLVEVSPDGDNNFTLTVEPK